MLRTLPQPVLCLLLTVGVALAGCFTTAKHTRTAEGFSVADLDRVAVVFSDGDVVRTGIGSTIRDSLATDAASTHVPSLLTAFASDFGVTLVDARDELADDPDLQAAVLASLNEAAKTIRAENREVARTSFAAGLRARNAPLAQGVPEELAEVSTRTEARYLLSVVTVGFNASAGAKTTDVLLRGAAAAFGVLVLGGANQFAVMETMIVDTQRNAIVWYSTRGGAVNPQDPEHLAALTRTVAFELFDGRRIAPESFLQPIGQDAVVYRFDGPRVTGTIAGFDGLDVVIDTRGGEERVPLREVKSIRGFTGTGKLFPLAIPMAE